MKRLALTLALVLCTYAATPTPPKSAPPKPTVRFELILSSASSGVLFRPEGPCNALLVLISDPHLPPAPAYVNGEFRPDGLYVNRELVKVEQFVVLKAPGCTVSSTPKNSKSL